MNRRLPVLSLEDIAIGTIRRYLSDHCWTVAKLYGGTEIEEVVNREEILPLHIAELRMRIFESIPWYLDEKVVKEIIQGIHEAVEEKQRQYNFNTHIPLYKTELYCMVTMVDLIVTPRIRRLEMPNIPKILRTHLTARLQACIMKETLICFNHICKSRTLMAYGIWTCCSLDLAWNHATPTAPRLLHPATSSQLFGA